MNKLHSGFTLLELLVALFIFSLLSAFSFRAVSLLSQSDVALKEQSDSLLDLQKFMFYWKSDVQGARNPPVVESSSGSAMSGDAADEMVLLTLDDVSSPANGKYVSGVPTNYTFNAGGIYRDRSLPAYKKSLVTSVNDKLLLLNNIEQAEVELIDGVSPSDPPIALKLSFVHKDYGVIHRVFAYGVGEADEELSTIVVNIPDHNNNGPSDVETNPTISDSW